MPAWYLYVLFHFSRGGASLRRGGWSSAIWTFTIAYLLRASEVTGMKESIADAFGKFRPRSPLRASGSHEERTAVFFVGQVVLADSTVFAHHSSRRVNGSNNAGCDLLKCVGSPRSYFFYRAWRITGKWPMLTKCSFTRRPCWSKTQDLDSRRSLLSKKREDVTLV